LQLAPCLPQFSAIFSEENKGLEKLAILTKNEKLKTTKCSKAFAETAYWAWTTLVEDYFLKYG
jgi:hypothetical protein